MLFRHLRGVAIAGAITAIVGVLFVGVVAAPAKSTHAESYTGICIGHKPQPFVHYYDNCTGHDEPEIDPVLDKPGTAQDITWTLILPTNGAMNVDGVGPTFWTGGTVSDPQSLLGQAFLEVQFYPNSMVNKCYAGGGYNVSYAPNVYTVCSPVWKVNSNNNEVAAFNAMLKDSASAGPLVMHAGDTISDHQYITPAADGMHITITDLTTGHSGTIILKSKTDGPLMPGYSNQKIGNALGWGLVNDAPNALVWEIGHTGNFTKPAGQFCLPGSATSPACYSYNIPSWLQFSPLQIKNVTFANGRHPDQWAVVSDYGGKAEVNQYCGAANYGQPFCQYPWYAYNATLQAITYGGDYPGTTRDFGRGAQFKQTTDCGGPYGADTTYCMTHLDLTLPNGNL
ncbi:MAG: hypothetical protein OJF49_001509 [Ktedonobacterales bacterium]|jgi:hypothetical protein|nr:MAG: hypothetical protein OJF49_001509 [Ktedonobacterales bacterium]